MTDCEQEHKKLRKQFENGLNLLSDNLTGQIRTLQAQIEELKKAKAEQLLNTLRESFQDIVNCLDCQKDFDIYHVLHQQDAIETTLCEQLHTLETFCIAISRAVPVLLSIADYLSNHKG